MNSIEYKQAKEKSGMKNPDIWCGYFRIARDTDKSYSSGRLVVPDELSKKIEHMVKVRESRVSLLVDKISSFFPDGKIEKCNKTSDITLKINESNTEIRFKNNGKDHFLNDLYSFIGPGKINHLILYYPEKPWVKSAADTEFDWVYWRSEPSQNIGIHNYQNAFTKELMHRLLLSQK